MSKTRRTAHSAVAHEARSHLPAFPRSHAAATLVLIGRLDLPAPHDAALRWPALPRWPAVASAVLARRLRSLGVRPLRLWVGSPVLAQYVLRAIAEGRLDCEQVCIDLDHPSARADGALRLARQAGLRITWTAADPHVAAWLRARGVDEERIALCPAWFEPPADRFVLRHQVRRRLDLEPEQLVALVLPPVTRASGAFEAVWGAMLAEKVEPRLRLILPAVSREAARVLRLVSACRHEFFVRPAPHAALAELLVAADVAILAAREAVSQTGLLSAAGAGVPLVATRVADAFGLLDASRLLLAVEPAAVAQALLTAVRDRAALRSAGRALRAEFRRAQHRGTGG